MIAGKDDVCERILDAARKRFSHYGYAKTTMAEIASDCDMSPGNLYRFFPGKLDIAEAIAREEERSRLADLARIVDRPGMSGRECLREFLFRELRATYAKFDQDPHAIEIAGVIAQRRPEFSEQRVAAEREMVGRILAQGTKTGEFAVTDFDYTAEMIHSATLKFRFPQRWTKTSLETLERELDGVLKLIMDGLTPRAGTGAA